MKKIIIFFLILTNLFICGCYSLRKKFIRKKHYKKEQPVYVDFKTYPEVPSKEAYINYYLFVVGWIDELKQSLTGIQNFKRQKRAINEAIMNLEQIIHFFNQEGKEKIYTLYQELLDIKKEIERNPHPTEMKKSAILSKIEYFKRNFERDFSYSKAEQWME